ncbi:MAG: hypothetical protein ABFS32_11815 [Bacteroidota bacterium]
MIEVAQMDPIFKKKISILIRLASIDGDFANVERSFIHSVCDKNGISRVECEKLIDNPEPIGTLGALSYPKVVDYMTDCLALMLADGNILPSEVILCEDIGLRLGFAKTSIDKIINELRDNLSISPNKIYELVYALPHFGKV